MPPSARAGSRARRAARQPAAAQPPDGTDDQRQDDHGGDDHRSGSRRSHRSRELSRLPITPTTKPSAKQRDERGPVGPESREARPVGASAAKVSWTRCRDRSCDSVEDARDGLAAVGYLAGESAALVSFLAARLGKPVLVEGPAGVGKTELAKALCRAPTGRRLVRLQCYEGLDEAKALYEWNYRKQLLRIQAEAADAGWERVQDDIFGEEFLLSRPLLQAIADDRAGRAADRRDRQDRPGVRGDAARGPVGLPGLDPRARRGRGALAARSCC